MLNALCGTTLLAASLTGHGPSRLPIQADGITPVTRPRLLASSFSRRLQGDIRRRASPPRTKRRLSLGVSKRVLVLFHAGYSLYRAIIPHFRRLSTDLCGKISSSAASSPIGRLLIPVKLRRVAVNAPEKQLPVPEFQQLCSSFRVKGHDSPGRVHPQTVHRLCSVLSDTRRPLFAFSPILCKNRIKVNMRFLHILPSDYPIAGGDAMYPRIRALREDRDL